MSGPDAHCTYVNAGWLAFTGRSLVEELGDGWAEGVFPEDYERCLTTSRDAVARRVPLEMEYRLRRADGTFRWLLDRGAPVYGSDGALSEYVSSCIDVTGRKEAEHAARAEAETVQACFTALAGVGRVLATSLDPEEILRNLARLGANDIPLAAEVGRRVGIALENARSFARERALARTLQISEQRYRSLVEATTSLVWTTDASGAFIEAQAGWETYTGQSWPDHAGFGWVDALHHEDREVVETSWREARARGDRYEVQGRLWHAPSSRYRHVVARGVP
ncbi:MAG: PAS domain-containing protein, partial [Actinomycetota bacterium]|nr:PAS domain-containing protein [Actinomycetota bacterium]